MNTRKINQKLFKDALVEAMLREFDRDMEHCEESPICSPEHYKRMSEIVGFDVTKPRRNKHKMSLRKRIIIFIIAAALALTGCVAAIYYRQIGNFIEEVYEKYIKVHFVDETPSAPIEIEDVYTLTYVPEGYELVDRKESTSLLRYQYQNKTKIISFEQYILFDTCHVVDLEDGYTQIFEGEALTVYYKELNNISIYKWSNGIYAFSIYDRQTLSQDEIIKMINSLKAN